MPAPKKKDGPTLDDKTSFNVTLGGPIKVGRRTVHPGPRVILRGDILAAAIAENADAVIDYTAEPA